MANSGINVVVKDGVSYVFDEARGKLLSIARVCLWSAVKSREVTNQFMRLEDGLPAMAVGDVVTRNGTITGLSLNTEASYSWTFEVYKQPSTLLASLSAFSQSKSFDNTLNVDVNAGDVLLFKANGTNIPLPRGMVELAWRL
jgi:hypothetical protein